VIKGKIFKRIGLFIIVFLFTITSKGLAKSLENEILLKGYVSNGFNRNNLEERNTLLRFQAENNLLVDGIIGELTKEALNKDNRRIIDIIPQEVEKKDWFIVVNKTKKYLPYIIRVKYIKNIL